MTTISVKFYKVKMPDGIYYADQGKSIQQVATKNNVNPNDVHPGADLLNMPPISDYYEKLEQVERCLS